MQPEDRIIHFSTELIHKPIKHKVPMLQKLYYELSQTRSAYLSSDFTSPVQYRFYSKRGDKTQSIALFLPDRTVLIEEWVDITMSGFIDKVREIIPRVVSGLGIPAFIAQTATIRSTFALTHFEDARVFLLDHACAQRDRIGPHFKRPVAVGGLRFVLPETPDHAGTFHVTIESFRHNLKEVFVETKGVFGKQNIDAENAGTAAANIQLVRGFIQDNVFPYLDQYDCATEEEAR